MDDARGRGLLRSVSIFADLDAGSVAALERIYSGLQNIAAGLDTLTDEIAAARRDVVRVHIG